MKPLRLLVLSALTSGAASAYTGTVQGNLFFNDMRESGNFAWRLDPSGQRGSGANPAGTAGGGSTNWLGALDVTAQLYEIDELVPGFPVGNLVDTAMVSANGAYTLNYAGLTDNGSALELAVYFELSFSDSQRKFEVADDGSVYGYWHPSAGRVNPRSVTNGTTTLSNSWFGGTSASYSNEHHQAALVFASMVDLTRVWHKGARWIGGTIGSASVGGPGVDATPVPFLLSEYGGITVNFPEGGVAGGYGKSPTEINIGAGRSPKATCIPATSRGSFTTGTTAAATTTSRSPARATTSAPSSPQCGRTSAECGTTPPWRSARPVSAPGNTSLTIWPTGRASRRSAPPSTCAISSSSPTSPTRTASAATSPKWGSATLEPGTGAGPFSARPPPAISRSSSRSSRRRSRMAR